jgi:Superinfection immunity protein
MSAFGVLFILAVIASWFVPLIIATLYGLPRQRAIAVLSLLLGWTGVAWLAALVIAVAGAITVTGRERPAQPEPPGPSGSQAGHFLRGRPLG